MIKDWQIEKIIEMRKQGKRYRDIAFELDISPKLVREISQNKSFNIQRKINNEEDEKKENTKSKYITINLQIPNKDYIYFQKLKEELKGKYGSVADEYVFLKLLEIYQKYVNILEENEKLKEIIKRNWGVK
jgi:hypothetical protein